MFIVQFTMHHRCARQARRLVLKQKLLRVRFDELYEVKGAFGCEMVSPGGGGFPKHLIYSYDLKTKTVIFPFGWVTQETDAMWHFYFKPYWDTFFQHRKVKKMDFVEVDCEPNQFQPLPELGLVTLFVTRRNKNRADKMIQKYLKTKTIIGQRSIKNSKTIIVRIGKGGKTTEKTVLQHLYELVLKKSEWKNFVKEVGKQNLLSKIDHFGLMMSEYVFPKQLANFNKNE